MKALVDGDVLVYEVGFGCQTGWEGDGPPPFDRAAELLDNKLNNILAIVGADNHQIYLTGKNNFREKIAVSRPYKGNRLQEKPFHYKNLRAYMVGKWNAIIVEGMEADDALVMNHTRDTILCGRDKDYRSKEGWFYSWELGNQPSFGPYEITNPGYLELQNSNKKLFGVGTIFFYSQILTGDRVDGILGLEGYGPKKTFEVLNGLSSESDMYNAVLERYKEKLGEEAESYLLEQGRLLHMTHRFENNKVLLWNPPNVDYEDWMNVDTGAIERVVLP